MSEEQDGKEMRAGERNRLKEAYRFWYQIADQAAASGDQSFQQMLDRLNKKLTNGQFRDAQDVANWLDAELAENPYWNSLTTEQRESDAQRYNPDTEADYKDNVKDRRLLIAAEARRIGFEIDEATLEQLAVEAQRNGWTDEEVRSAIRPIADQTGGELTGIAGNYAAKLSEWANRNGLSISEQDADRLVLSIGFDEMTFDQVKNELRQQYMIGAFPAWAEQIQKGFDVYDLAAPYRGVAQRMLGRTDISMSDPFMQQMMQYQDESGAWKARPLWEAEKYVRNTDEWQYTDDAYNTYASIGDRIGKMFGFG